jgi:predicted RNA-binding Zn-ribbon protein involved in translation (DUF1610 family)
MMQPCNHANLELLPVSKPKLRCRHCYLTLAAEDLRDGFCPECFESSGEKRYDFEEIKGPENSAARYRCDDCGVIITST